MTDLPEIGKWLEFDAGTCFGEHKKHFGVLVGIDYDTRKAVVAVNATSQIESLIHFADFNDIPIEDAMVCISKDDLHFSKPTAIDCHRPKEISLDQLKLWLIRQRVRKTSFNEDLSPETMSQIITVMLRSRLVPESTKSIIKTKPILGT